MQKKWSIRIYRGFDSTAGFFKAWRWCPKRLLCVNQNAGDRQGLPPARDTLRRTPTAISLAGCVPAIGAYFRFSRPTYATKSQLLIQIIRTPPPCLQKSTFPGLPTINPDGPKKYIVRLINQERAELTSVIKKLAGTSQKVTRAQVLLKSDADGPAWTDAKIADAFNCRTKAIENIRQQLVENGFRETLDGKKRDKPPTPKVLDGEQEACIIATRLGSPPKGYANWSLRLLARKVVACDNLNTHTIGAFYEVFEPERARSLVRRIEFHYTPNTAVGFKQYLDELNVHVDDERYSGFKRLVRPGF